MLLVCNDWGQEVVRGWFGCLFLKHVPVRHIPEYMLNHVPGQVLNHVPGHVLKQMAHAFLMAQAVLKKCIA